jgi:acetyl esterase
MRYAGRSTTGLLCAVALAGCAPAGGGMTAGVMAPPPADPGAAATLARADADMRAVLEQHMALGPKPIEMLTPQEARTQPTPADAVRALLERTGRSTAPEPVARVQDRTIPGPGGPIPVRIYTPAGTGPFPVVVYSHGGGWVIATIDTYDGSARALANAAGAIVVSIEYRKGPENPFPAAHDDAFAAYQWALQNAASIGGDPLRVAVAGESAGGGLALATALTARERNVRMPVHVLAVYPIADGDTESPSYVENAMAKPLNRPMMEWFFRHYLRGPGDARDPRISLVRADLRGMPPTTIVLAEIDPLRSDGEELAARLRAAGVQADLHVHQGVAHEFFGMGAVVADARTAVQQAAAGLRRGFGM